MGFPFTGPQNRAVENSLLPLAALGPMISSSSCLFETASPEAKKFNSGVLVTVWYLQDADPETAKDTFLATLEKNFQGRLNVDGLGYPAVYTHPNSSLYVFSRASRALVILQATVLGAPTEESSKNPSIYLGQLLDREKKIALRALGAPQKLAGVVSTDRILSADEALRGQRAMSVVVNVAGIRDIPEATFRSDLVVQLQRLGITVFPRNDPPKFPVLRLNVDATLARLTGSLFTVYTLSLEFRELFPLQSASAQAQYVRTTVWSTGSFGAMPSIQAMSLRAEADKLTSEFAKVYRAVNNAGR